jgi:hypothetical protein
MSLFDDNALSFTEHMEYVINTSKEYSFSISVYGLLEQTI